MNYLAQRSINSGVNMSGIGNIGNITSPADAASTFNQIISTSIGLMTVIAIIWFTFVFLTGAYSIMSSGGEKGAYETAQKKIRTGLIGLVAVIAGVFLLDFAGWIFGFGAGDILNPGNWIINIGI
jgi:hypothetical protein